MFQFYAIQMPIVNEIMYFMVTLFWHQKFINEELSSRRSYLLRCRHTNLTESNFESGLEFTLLQSLNTNHTKWITKKKKKVNTKDIYRYKRKFCLFMNNEWEKNENPMQDDKIVRLTAQECLLCWANNRAQWILMSLCHSKLYKRHEIYRECAPSDKL